MSDMPEIKRYSLEEIWHAPGEFEMTESKTGEWVTVDDFEEIQARVAELEALVPRWTSKDEKPTMTGVYLCMVYKPWDNLKWLDTRGFSPEIGWAVDDGEHIVRWMPIPPTPQEDA